MGAHSFVALDLGAESGRAVVGTLRGGSLSCEEVYRFPNQPVAYGGELHWDLPRLWWEVQRALEIAGQHAHGRVTSIGVDAWGLDYALLSKAGTLLENAYHYRDARTDGMLERVCEIVPPDVIYEQTGVQLMQINALYQLYAGYLKNPDVLRAADRLLTIPDLFNYWLTGQAVCEFTNATTTQLFDARRGAWAVELLERLGMPTHFLAPVVQPGTVLGPPLPGVAAHCGQPLVVAPATHDTGSAVAAIPMAPNVAFISSGTWSLLGTEVPGPIVSETARRFNFTNEGGVCGTNRLLKNIAGLWLVQSCRRQWKAEGRDYDYGALAQEAAASAPLRSLMDPDHPCFLNGEGVPAKIDAYCRLTCQPAPETPGAYIRAALESLALKYRYVLEALEETAGARFDVIRIVGGGARNALLNQLTADATGRRVQAGPIEATALGNLGMQMLATGHAQDLASVRRLIDASAAPVSYEPRDASAWDAAWSRFGQYCASPPVLRN